MHNNHVPLTKKYHRIVKASAPDNNKKGLSSWFKGTTDECISYYGSTTEALSVDREQSTLSAQ